MQLAIITHPLDRRLKTLIGGRVPVSAPFYQIDAMLIEGRRHGLRWFFTDPDQAFRPADAAILHVDQSLIAQPFLDLAARYPVAVNGRVSDIRKRAVSRNLLHPASDWPGPVLVKSDLNCAGGPENFLARKSGGPALPPVDYRIFDHLSQVPDAVWSDPAQVVERYLPEQRDGLNVLRIWSFFGEYERCNWYTSTRRIVKSSNFIGHGPAEVPEVLRAERRRLGFDFGKFDFALGPDGPVLYDANKTPGYLGKRPDLMRAAGREMTRTLARMVVEKA
ncbi:MAG: hypothetical protein B7Z31_07800 [Rhodobacterales bacterium 12-65-15]|nr:MAG: hypothetical protein B7Z31_07800 [Rhodobacterales bacterium 12-65-15]